MARETGIAAVVGRRYWREAEARVVVEAWRASGESLAGHDGGHVDLQSPRASAPRGPLAPANAVTTCVNFSHPCEIGDEMNTA